ncbi:hypothetical protein ACROYT_G014722 [Oculina patagonica]
MKNGKAPGADGICAELLKAGKTLISTILQKIFQEIWISENMPEDWKTGLIVRLAKKGDLSDCNNWRGVTLLSLTSKVFSKIILGRMSAALEKDIRKEQAGFRKGRSCSDHIFTLRQIFEQAKGWNSTVMKNATQDQRGIRWTLYDVLSDLDFADDICLLAHRHTDMQVMTEGLASTAAVLGLKISPKKTKHMRMNHRSDAPITLHGKIVEEVNEFTYLGSKMTTNGDSESEIKARLFKAGQAFASLKNVWKSKMITLKTKLCFFKKLRQATSTNNINSEVKKRRWRWIRHVLRMDPSSISRVAMHWTSSGKRARGRPKETWRRTVENEMRASGVSWGELRKKAKDRQQWWTLLTALCAQWHEED